MEDNNKITKLSKLLSVILIGAVGSGLWEILLKDSIYFLGSIFVRMAASIYEGYFDRLYESVGEQINLLFILPGILITVLIISLPMYLYLYLSHKLEKINRMREVYSTVDVYKSSKLDKFLSNQIQFHQTRFKLALIAPMLISSLAMIDIFIVSSSSYRAVREVQRRLEIIRPYVSDEVHYKFSSEFRLIDNRQKLQNLINKIDTLAYDNKQPVPELRLYGVKSFHP